MKGYIYMIYNDLTDDIYVGSTMKNIDVRFKQHLRTSKNWRYSKFYNFVNRLGVDKFHIKLLDTVEFKQGYTEREHLENLRYVEGNYIKKYKPSLNSSNVFGTSYESTDINSNYIMKCLDKKLKESSERLEIMLRDYEEGKKKMTELYGIDFD